MAIDSALTETVTISNLPDLALALNNFFAHNMPTDTLEKANVQALTNYMAPFVASIDNSGYIATNGTVLPATTATAAYTIVGKGSFTQTPGSPVVTTGDINIVSWNGTTWSFTTGINLNMAQTMRNYLLSQIQIGVIQGLNLVDWKKQKLGYRALINNGLEESNSIYQVTNYIPINPGQDYAINDNQQVVLYDTDMQYISGGIMNYFLAPSNGGFVRISSPIGLRTLQMQFGNIYTPYIENVVHADSRSLRLKAGKNIFNFSNAMMGFYVQYTTGNIASNAGSIVTDFHNIKPSTAYIVNIVGRHIAWYDKNFKYLGGDISGSFITHADACYYRAACVEIEKNQFQIEEGTTVTALEPFYQERFGLRAQQSEIKYTTVTVNSTADYAIRNAVLAIKDNSYYNRYTVFVPNGVYFEMDIQCKDYVDITGQSDTDAIIIVDGTSTKLAPTNLSIGGAGGIPLNTLANDYKHIFWLNKTCTISNLKMVGKDVKYCIHQDSGQGDYNSMVKNCTLQIVAPAYRCVGIGSRGGQYQNYKDCYFINPQFEAMGWHNSGTPQKSGSGMTVENCKSDGWFIDVADLGSEKEDIVRLVNCRSLNPSSRDLQYTATLGFWPSTSAPTSNPLLIPYNIKVVFQNTNLSVSQINRPNYKLFN